MALVCFEGVTGFQDKGADVQLHTAQPILFVYVSVKTYKFSGLGGSLSLLSSLKPDPYVQNNSVFSDVIFLFVFLMSYDGSARGLVPVSGSEKWRTHNRPVSNTHTCRQLSSDDDLFALLRCVILTFFFVSYSYDDNMCGTTLSLNKPTHTPQNV